jgi:hypothetical protein
MWSAAPPPAWLQGPMCFSAPVPGVVEVLKRWGSLTHNGTGIGVIPRSPRAPRDHLAGVGPRPHGKRVPCVAILEDYQGVALRLADRRPFPPTSRCSATISRTRPAPPPGWPTSTWWWRWRSDTFSAHADRAPTALQALGDLGMRNAAIDLRAAADRGGVVSGGESASPLRGRADLGAHPLARAARARQLRPGWNGGA